MLAGMLLLEVTGYPALPVFAAIARACLHDWYGFGQVLRMTGLLTFTGLAVAVAFQAGLFNVGVEGQLYIGSLAIAIAAHYMHTPWADQAGSRGSVQGVICIGGLVVLAMLAAGLWAAIPGALKTRTGAHEVITTIMMNFVAYAVVNYFLRPAPGSFAAPGTLHTARLPDSLLLPRLSSLLPVFKGSSVNVALFLAPAAAAVVYFLLRFTKFGFEIRAIGKSPLAARAAGIRQGRIAAASMFLSGAIAGLVGADAVLGHKGYFEKDFSGGLGFIGIAVALLAGNHPGGVIPAALLFAVLNYGKVAAAGLAPKEIIDIMEAATIFAVAASAGIGVRWRPEPRGRETTAPQRECSPTGPVDK